MMGTVRTLAIAAMLVVCLGPMQAVAEPPRVFDGASWKTLVEARQGRPLIVHFWGFTCGNCMVELKAWGEFAAKHPHAAIAFVNWDRRGADPARIEKTLAKSGLERVESFTLANGYEEKLRFAVDRDWLGELPYTRLIAADGTITSVSGAADFAHLAHWLAPAK